MLGRLQLEQLMNRGAGTGHLKVSMQRRGLEGARLAMRKEVQQRALETLLAHSSAVALSVSTSAATGRVH